MVPIKMTLYVYRALPSLVILRWAGALRVPGSISREIRFKNNGHTTQFYTNHRNCRAPQEYRDIFVVTAPNFQLFRPKTACKHVHCKRSVGQIIIRRSFVAEASYCKPGRILTNKKYKIWNRYTMCWKYTAIIVAILTNSGDYFS